MGEQLLFNEETYAFVFLHSLNIKELGIIQNCYAKE